ncbi:MAG: DUF6036 family nucleotidyltransferase [Pseudomonadota bacterium]
MKLEELQHVLRASAAIAEENSFVVVGSQAVLLLLEQPPEALLVSREIDLYPALHPERADLIDGAIGMHSSFHETFGYFADGVGPETAVMPADWMSRASLHYIGDVTAICPDLHDLVVSKCVAGREKDADFVRELLKNQLVSATTLAERIAMLDASKYPLPALVAWVEWRKIESERPTP